MKQQEPVYERASEALVAARKVIFQYSIQKCAFWNELMCRCKERLEKQKEEETNLSFLAENEKTVKKLWDQYSVRAACHTNRIEPLCGELPIRKRATHFVLPRARLQTPDGMLRRRAASLGSRVQQHDQVLASPRRPHLQRGLESVQRGRDVRLLLPRQSRLFFPLTRRDGEAVGLEGRRAGSAPHPHGPPQPRDHRQVPPLG